MRQPHQTHLSAFTEEEDSLRISGQELNPGYAGLTLDPGDGGGIMPLLNSALSGLSIASLARCGYLLRSPAAPPRAALRQSVSMVCGLSGLYSRKFVAWYRPLSALDVLQQH